MSERSPGFYDDDDGEIAFVPPPPKRIRRMKCLDEAEYDRREEEISALRAEVEAEQGRSYAALHAQRAAEAELGEAHKACEVTGDKLDDANRKIAGLKTRLTQAEQRAERAEALLEKATEFDLGDDTCLKRQFTGHWRIAQVRHEEEGGVSLYFLGRDWRWHVAVIGGDAGPVDFDSLDAALAAYEQSRETTDA